MVGVTTALAFVAVGFVVGMTTTLAYTEWDASKRAEYKHDAMAMAFGLDTALELIEDKNLESEMDERLKAKAEEYEWVQFDPVAAEVLHDE